MSQQNNQRTSAEDVAGQPASDSDDGGNLSEQRAATDRLFAIAEKSFAAMAQGDSREFLRRSRQTGGQ